MPSKGFSKPEILVSTQWLEEHIGDSDIRIVDCDPFDSYTRAHIEGAAGIKVHHYIKHPDYARDPKSYPLVAEPDVVKELFEDMGIGDDTTVVAYDSSGSLWASRFWWVLNYYGHNNSRVLDGGWKKWFDEGRPVSIDRPVKKEVTFTPKSEPGLVCLIDDAMLAIGNDETLFLDVRSDGEWTGTVDRGNGRSGRIPDAVHLEWLNFVTNDKHHTFKSPQELRDILEAAGVTPEKEIVTY